MTPTDKGRFCASCQKNVVDFTRSSDREVLAYLKEHNNVCGRFSNNQLDRELTLPAQKSRLWPAAAAIAGLLTLAPVTAVSQTTESTEQTPGMKMGKVLLPPTVTVTGMVSDAEGPLPRAKVAIQNTAISVETDINGNYAIEARPGQTLIFTYREFEMQKSFVLRNSKVINVTFAADEILGHVVVEAYRTTRCTTTVGFTIATSKTVEEPQKRTFFGRIFHSIGNLFR